MTGPPLLEVEDLRTWFDGSGGTARAVDGVSFRVEEGETLGLVGESGCGKSVTALSLTRLVPEPPGRILPGSSVRLRGEELLEADEARLREVRGGEIAMIFQEPTTSLNPVMRVGEQVVEAIRAHRPGRGSGAREEAEALLGRVGIPRPGERFGAYPHELSGGQRQRVMIAMALACRPSLLVADEPTTALDVTVQAQILDLLRSLQREHGMGLLLISHDLGVVAEMADRVAVMYAGQLVEEAPAAELYGSPRHPYTEGLMRAVPDPDRRRERLTDIAGTVPHPSRWPEGCRFHPRCPHAWDRCRAEGPPLLESDGEGRARCWLLREPGRRREGEA
jgi:peptide/nickel transport system ATP-binding protein/oligopeptide transport system ATP-binding protein